MNKTSSDQTLLANIIATSRELSSVFDAHLRSTGLTAARGRVLYFLAGQTEPVGQAQITAFLRVENPTAVRILDGLEGLGYIRRLPDRMDRRAKLIELTARGKPRAEAVVELTKYLNDAIMEGIAASEVKAARRMLAKMGENIARMAVYGDPQRAVEEIVA